MHFETFLPWLSERPDTVPLLFGSERDARVPGTARLVVVGLVLLDLLVGLKQHNEGWQTWKKCR